MLYRFRSTSRVLENKEIEDNYFYFASPSQQNDPMEGYIDFFWKGDWIAWMGLFKHYTWQVFMTLFEIPLHLELEDLCKLHLWHTEIHHKNTKLPEYRIQIEDKVAADEKIMELATALADSQRKLTSTELQTTLFIIHKVALYYANQLLEDKGLQIFSKSEATERFLSLAVAYQGIDAFITLLKSSEQLSQACKVTSNTLNSVILMSQMTMSKDEPPIEHKALAFLFADFPENYVRQIPRLSFPDWYCVCFNTNAQNPALWGYYADGHKGICLVFNNDPAKGIYLTEMNTGMKQTPKYFPIHKVAYGEAPVRVDFFSSLGNLWGDERTHWLKHNGEQSQVLTSIFEDVDGWREEYHANNKRRFLRKSAAWEAENEYRIILDDFWENHQNSRKFSYKFEDLDGIIFGIKTPTDQKLSIIDAVRKKCEKTGRELFNFYQASYNSKTSQIEIEPIPLLSDISQIPK